MRVLHVNYTDEGGAFVALKRIDEALKLNFKDSYVSSLLIINPLDINSIQSPLLFGGIWSNLVSFVRPRVVRIITKILFKSVDHTESYNILRSNKIVKYINGSDFDIVHLHWIGGETISIRDFKRIKKKIVWTMHDSWGYLGRQHYPKLTENSAKTPAIDQYLIDLKAKTWRKHNMNVVCVSEWLYKETVKSGVFNSANLLKIANTIDVDFWKPFDSTLSRTLLNLSTDKIYLCMGAVKPTTDIRKGFDLLKEVLSLMPGNYKNKIELLMFGWSADDTQIGGVNTRFLGKIADQVSLKLLIDAIDVVLVPSYLESFGQTALEGIAMGKLVVCFDASGTTDIVDHLENGYAASSYDTADFARGIIWAIDNYKRSELGLCAREKAVMEFSYKTISSAYYNLYVNQLSQNR